MGKLMEQAFVIAFGAVLGVAAGLLVIGAVGAAVFMLLS